MKDFKYWKALHDSGKFDLLGDDANGLLWLKTKSIIRSKLIKEFCEQYNIVLVAKKQEGKFIELFNLFQGDTEKYNTLLDLFSRKENSKQLDLINTKQLTSELFKLKSFDWGGDYQNALDKFLVNQYVKKHQSFDALQTKFNTEINEAVKGYVLNSWYNHWSSILIEHIFKSHPVVLPTVGQIQNVDFFIHDIPFDLKVTYFPAEYIKRKRKENGYPVELTFLRKKAKEAKIEFDKKAKANDIIYEITEKMEYRNDDFCNSVLATLKQERTQILQDAKANPKELATWLYNNQGDMRFSSENRLFLILIDSKNIHESWKLKRDIEFLAPTIKSYLDNFDAKRKDDLKVNFSRKGKSEKYTAYGDVIFVVKEQTHK